MDQLIDIVVERTGIPRDQAEKAVDAIVGFLRDNPDQLTQVLGNDALGQVSQRLGGLFGR